MAKSIPQIAWHRCPNCGVRAYVREGTYHYCDENTETVMERIINPPPEPPTGEMTPPLRPAPKPAKPEHKPA